MNLTAWFAVLSTLRICEYCKLIEKPLGSEFLI